MGTLMAPLMLGLMLGWSATAVRAQTAPPASAPVDGAALGLQEAIAHALDRQPELRATKAGVDVALGIVRTPASLGVEQFAVHPRGDHHPRRLVLKAHQAAQATAVAKAFPLGDRHLRKGLSTPEGFARHGRCVVRLAAAMKRELASLAGPCRTARR